MITTTILDCSDARLHAPKGLEDTFLVAQRDDNAGFITLSFNYERNMPSILTLEVLEPYSGRELAAQGMNLAEDYIVHNTGDQVVLWVARLRDVRQCLRSTQPEPSLANLILIQ